MSEGIPDSPIAITLGLAGTKENSINILHSSLIKIYIAYVL